MRFARARTSTTDGAEDFGADSGRDPHQLRSTAKMVNYALLYGKTAFTLAKDIGVTPQEAQAFIDAYFAGFPRVRAFIDHMLEEARTRRRPHALRTTTARAGAEQQEYADPPGGRAGSRQHAHSGHGRGHPQVCDDRHARRDRARFPRRAMILTVHDELLFEVSAERADEAAAVVRERMQGAAQLTVPLTVDVGIGPNWNEAKP